MKSLIWFVYNRCEGEQSNMTVVYNRCVGEQSNMTICSKQMGVNKLIWLVVYNRYGSWTI